MTQPCDAEPAMDKQGRIVLSADGTPIEYFSFGSGPAVIVVPGALSTADGYFRFADALGAYMSVHVIQRRGRGRSGPQGANYGINCECDDLFAVQAETGAKAIVGHSFGGLVALEAARINPVFERLVVYEPGVSIGGSISMTWLARYDELLARGKQADAFAVFSMGTGPDRGRRTPLWLMKLLLPRFVSSERRATMYPLLQQNSREHRAVRECDDHLAAYAAITASVLIMKGGRTGIRWVDLATAALTEVLPSSRTMEFAELNHFGIDQEDPETVATAAASFLGP